MSSIKIHAQRLKQARVKRANGKLTRMQVQEHTGINNKTLAGYENGVANPDFETLSTLCAFYGVSTDWVLGHTNNPNGSLDPAERELVQKINLEDDSLLDIPMMFGDREVTEEEKKKVLEMVRLLLK